jgi:hypothetical protein
MFIIGGRALGTLAGLICAGIVALALGGCASAPETSASALAARAGAAKARQCSAGGARVCVVDAAGRVDARCGCEDLGNLQAAFDRLPMRDR